MLDHPENTKQFTVWDRKLSEEEITYKLSVASCALDYLAHWTPELEVELGCTRDELIAQAWSLLECKSWVELKRVLGAVACGSED